jgi:hypothetical protein
MSKTVNCSCLQKALNQWSSVEEVTSISSVYYLSKSSEKGYDEKSAFLKSNYCPQCGEKYIEKED